MIHAPINFDSFFAQQIGRFAITQQQCRLAMDYGALWVIACHRIKYAMAILTVMMAVMKIPKCASNVHTVQQTKCNVGMDDVYRRRNFATMSRIAPMAATNRHSAHVSSI